MLEMLPSHRDEELVGYLEIGSFMFFMRLSSEAVWW